MNEFLITLEDRPGSMAECCVAIGDAGINILGGCGLGNSVAAAVLVTEESDETAAALESIGVKFTMRNLQTTVLEDVPGALGGFTRSLAENGINLASIYIMSTGADGVKIGYSTD
ncbi:MAG: hypothetical protein QGI21_07345 [Candidatus Poseidoniaceae archaeon]|jgi:hypothetical protein|nr:hypothetical protein [Candidatus Poseidoniaceae archaeon]